MRATAWWLSIVALCVTGCPRVDAFACEGAGACDLAMGGVCVDGWCAYPDSTCDEGHRWHGGAPGVGGMCVPLDPETTSIDPATSSASSSSSSSESSSSSGLPACGEQLVVRIDTMTLAGDTMLDGYPLVIAIDDPALVDAEAIWWSGLDGAALAHEIEAFDAEAGSVRAWVRLPAWTPAEPLDILLRFGDPMTMPANDPADVWSEYVGVWHLDDPLTGGDMDVQLDSSGNEQHGVARGGMTAEQVVDAVIGSGIAFSGDADDAVELVESTFAGSLDSSTISIWGRVDSDGTIENPFFEKVNGDNLYPRCRVRPDEDGALQCQTIVDEVPVALRADASLVPRGDWHHVAITYDASTGLFQLYANGAFVTEETMAAMPQGGGEYVPQIGRINEFGGLIGVLDEFRVLDHPVSAEWIAADERSQRDPASISSVVGSAEPSACP